MRNRIALVACAMLVVGLLVGLTTSASAGPGDPSAPAKKKKKKKCPAGTHKVVVKKKNGKKKRKCVADAPATPAPTGTSTLTVTPSSFTYPAKTQNSCNQDADPPDSDCTTQIFTVTNTGGAASGTLATSIVELTHPAVGAHDPAFVFFSFPPNTANACAGVALAPGASCSVSVLFDVPSNSGDGNSTSVLHVVGSPGGDAAASLAGHSN
jgi:hypothetical protein